MVYHKATVNYYQRTSSGSYPSSPTFSFTQVLQFDISYTLNATADSLTVVLHDFDGSMASIVNPYDIIRIVGNIGGADITVIDGLIQNVKCDRTPQGDTITLQCQNRLEKLFNGLVRVTGNVAKTADAWIQDMLTQVNALNRFQPIVWDSGNDALPDTAAVTYKVGYIPGWQVLRDMSQPANTVIPSTAPNGNYYDFYLDMNNHLIWKQRTTNVVSTLYWGTDIENFHSEQGVFNIINYVIINAGKDPSGFSILALGSDSKSIMDNGWKMKVIPQMGIATQLTITERNANSNRFGTTNNYPTTYPYTTTWGVTTTSDTDYRGAFRTQAKSVAQKVINQVLLTNKGRVWKNTLAIVPNLSFQVSNLYYISNPDLNSNANNDTQTAYSDTPFRVVTINYRFDTRGWQTSLEIDQDPAIL